jgi:hypothetical protein
MNVRMLPAALAVLALAAFAGSGRSEGIGRPLLLRPATVTTPLLGVRDGSLVRLDPRTLKPKGPGVLLAEYSALWSFSPDRRQLVFVKSDGSQAAARFVDVSTLRPLRDVALGASARVALVDWVAPERLLTVGYSCCPQAASTVSIVDAVSGTVLARNTVEGDLVGAGQVPGALVLLLEPQSFGPVRIAVAGSDGTLRSTVLDQVRAGVTQTPAPQNYFQLDSAGLAVNSSVGRAYVVAANDPVAELDLRTLTVDYHTPSRPVSLLGRLDRWLEPAASVKEAYQRSIRRAVYISDGRLAVFGQNGIADQEDGFFRARTKPSGLTLIDTNTWTSRILDPRSAAAVVARGKLLSYGWKWDSLTQTETGNGLRVYGPDGSMRLQLLRRAAISDVEVVGSRAFVRRYGPYEAYSIVSLRSGRVLGNVEHELPLVLRGAGSGF